MTTKRLVGALAALAFALTAVVAHAAPSQDTTRSTAVVAGSCDWCRPGK